jgi:hypothetical protein
VRVKDSRRVSLTPSSPSVNRLYRKCRILDVSTTYYRDSISFYTSRFKRQTRMTLSLCTSSGGDISRSFELHFCSESVERYCQRLLNSIKSSSWLLSFKNCIYRPLISVIPSCIYRCFSTAEPGPVPGPRLIEKRIYPAAVWQSLRTNGIHHRHNTLEYISRTV